MKRAYLLAGGALVLCSTLVMAQSAPESLLPPGVGQPAPTPTPAPVPTATSAPSAPADPTAPAPPQGSEVVQPIPSTPGPVDTSGVSLSDIPSVEELEELTVDELDDLLGLKPRYDIPPAARRSTERVGIIDEREGGLPVASLARQPASIVRAALANTSQPLVSRWGHILMRRALASRLAAPEGMNPVEFAALRAAALNAMGEHSAARALVQDVDTADYSSELTEAALDAYVGTGDITGACPVVRLGQADRDDVQWKMFEGICAAYAGETTAANNELRRLLSRTEEDRIDVLLAQRYAGAAGQGRRAVTIEWDGIEAMNPWRFALANALGEPIPDGLLEQLGPYYLKAGASTPALPIVQRLRGADLAAAAGIFSSAAMVDLYSQLYADRGEQQDADAAIARAARLRDAYVDPDAGARLAAIRDVWSGDDEYAGLVLTAYASARLTPSNDFEDDAPRLIASMLTAGLDRDAMRWADVVEEGSVGWALLALANPQDVAVTDGQLATFENGDESSGQRKSKMLLAGLAGLGRTDADNIAEYSERLGVNLRAPTAWTRMIDKAAEANNGALVVMLAGLGMQGTNWDQMTARHLYHIVSALNRVGLNAEARMIAAEAVARA
ncbi:hypothetical protein [Qipengyuania gelatinilytica]|uniref:Uncharacterized protein n=1 Tax=Qipengyuania gelatinilytica TaxID=2867231 RepID=A0ABX9A343_9SPHN|nr:hypothetical protein [Qipengyuania gelatinilytica]QZD95685.1 hypothetical protein K3136_02870 [Qipengyuania gelatinilytica]